MVCGVLFLNYKEYMRGGSWWLQAAVAYKDIYPTYKGSILTVSQRLHLQIPSHWREEFYT